MTSRSRIALLVNRIVLPALMLACFASAPLCRAQEQQPSLDSIIQSARGEMTAERNEIITAAMGFSDKEAASFWPIYRKYEYERTKIDDVRAAVVKSYAQKYPDVSDQDAKSMLARMIDCDSRTMALKRKYVKEFSKALPPSTVAKFFQLEHRIDLVMDMRVETSLPPLMRPQTAGEQK